MNDPSQHTIATPSAGRRFRSRAEMLLGNDRALSSAGRRRDPDKRQLSTRWFAGVFLTGISSLALMGGALHAALDGRQELAIPANLLADNQTGPSRNSVESGKGDRLKPLPNLPQPTDKRVLSVATMVRQGDVEVIKTRQFTHVTASLAVGPDPDLSYPRFNPLAVFSGETAAQAAASLSGRIYGAEVESEVVVQVESFPASLEANDDAYRMSVAAAEQIVRDNISLLTDETVQLASLSYVNPTRFDLAPSQGLGLQPLNITIIEDNISALDQASNAGDRYYDEQIVSIPKALGVQAALATASFPENEVAVLAPEIAAALGTAQLSGGQRMVLSLERFEDGTLSRVMRVSFYEGSSHLVSFARRDDDVFVASETPYRRLVASNNQPAVPQQALPQVMTTIYDSI